MTRDELALFVLVVACLGVLVSACGMAILIVREIGRCAPIQFPRWRR